MDRQFEKALAVERSSLLQKTAKAKKKVFPFVINYNPRLPNVNQIIRRNLHLLNSNSQLQETFPNNSIFPAYRRGKNLKEILAPSKFKTHSNNESLHGCTKCNKRCDLCKNYFAESCSFKSSATSRYSSIKQNVTCTTRNAIYLATCIKCDKQYVGSTKTEFKVRFRNHKSDMKNNKKTCELATLFNSLEHQLSDISFIVIETISHFRNDSDLESILLTSY